MWSGDEGPGQGLNVLVCAGGEAGARDAGDAPGRVALGGGGGRAQGVFFSRGRSVVGTGAEESDRDPDASLAFQSLQDGEDSVRPWVAAEWAGGGAGQGEGGGEPGGRGLCSPCTSVDMDSWTAAPHLDFLGQHHSPKFPSFPQRQFTKNLFHFIIV